MDCILYNQLDSILSGAFNIFKGLRESKHQLAASLTEPSLISTQCTDTASDRGWLSSSTYLDYLSVAEAEDIIQQFESISQDDCQLLFWSGIPRECAQKWADARGMSTLTTMMGPLMDTSSVRCPKRLKSSKSWSKYVKGASIMFSLYANKAGTVTVLTMPPHLQIIGLRPGCTFLSIEEPILKGKLGGSHNVEIKVVHPMVEGAQDLAYQVWPTDHTKEWIERFGTASVSFEAWGGRLFSTKTATLKLAIKARNIAEAEGARLKQAKKARNIAEAEAERARLKQAKKAKNIAEAERAMSLKQAKKAKNIAEAEAERARLKQAKKAKNIAEAERAMSLKQAKKAKNIAETEKARSLKQAKKAKNIAETEKARNLKQAKKARNIAEAETARRLKQAKKARNIAEAETARRLKQAKKSKKKRAKKAKKKVR